jgi:hypothetical protein
VSIFADWQPAYAARNIATFPVVMKRPAVSGYLKLGSDVSSQLVMKFPDADALGFALGKRSNVTVLDIDTPDERILAEALDRHGRTPIIVRSGSGNFQAWFAHAGEGRKIRPEPGRPIDILGGGFVVAPPSRGSRGQYEFIAGGLDDLDRLPLLAGLASNIVLPDAASLQTKQGERNETLFKDCLRRACRCSSFHQLLLFARNLNEGNMPQLPDAEVVKTARSAWDYQQRGENFLAGETSAILTHDVIDRLAAQDPHAFALLALLERYHGRREEFAVANAMADKLGWHIARLRSARAALVDMNIIRCVHPGGKGPKDPALFTWT